MSVPTTPISSGDDALWAQARAGDDDARERILSSHVKLVMLVAHRLIKRLDDRVELGELISAGSFGLIAAFESFDPTKGFAFSTYAVPRIKGAMLDGLRKLDPASRATRRKAREAHEVSDGLTQRLGRRATESEVAAHLGVSALELSRLKSAVEVADPLSIDHATGDAPELQHTIAMDAPEHAMLDDEDRAAIHALFAELPEAERVIVALYRYEGLKLADIGELMGRAESRIQQQKKDGEDKLRELIEERDIWH